MVPHQVPAWSWSDQKQNTCHCSLLTQFSRLLSRLCHALLMPCVPLHLSYSVCVCLKSQVMHCVMPLMCLPVNKSCSRNSSHASGHTLNPNTWLCTGQGINLNTKREAMWHNTMSGRYIRGVFVFTFFTPKKSTAIWVCDPQNMRNRVSHAGPTCEFLFCL